MPTVRKIEKPAKQQSSDSPPGFPKLTLEMIINWVGEKSFGRSQGYLGHSIFDTRRTGMTLKARCQGTDYQPYTVRAVLDAHGIMSDDCSCPVESHCKHVAALLQTWLNDPEVFTEVESLDQTLERRDKAELIGIIHRMVDRYPDLELMLELPTVVADKQGQPLNAKLMRQQIDSIFHGADIDDWDASADMAVRLEPFAQLGRQYGAAGDWRSAMLVYRAVITGVTEHYGELNDENGDLQEVVAECVDGLGEVVAESQDDSPLRIEALRVMFDVYRWDIMYDGIDMAAGAPNLIVQHITPDERRMVIAWVEEAMAAIGGSDQWSKKWRQQALGGFLVAVRGAELSDEEFLELNRKTGRVRDVVGRLLELGRTDEAVAEVRKAEPSEALELADMVRDTGHSQQAEDAIGKRQDGPPWQERYDEWLRERAVERGDTGAALALVERLFWRRPDLHRYEQFQAHAQAHGTWNTLRPEVLRKLERDKHYGLLTEAQLREGEIEQALKSLKQVTNWQTANDEPLSIRVAKAAEPIFPREALALYAPHIERLIDWSGRENYRLAARYLSRSRELYRRLGEMPTWDKLIAQIREKHRRLRSLKEELERAGL